MPIHNSTAQILSTLPAAPPPDFEPLSDEEVNAICYKTGKNRQQVIAEHRLRHASALPPVLSKAREGVSKADAARDRAEAGWTAAQQLQSSYDARLAEADRIKSEISLGEQELGNAIAGEKWALENLDQWPLQLSRDSRFVANVIVQVQAFKFFQGYLPDWLTRRRAALTEYESATAEFARANGIKSK